MRSAFDKALKCRTAELGAEGFASEREELIVYHTCKSRACPSCGYRAGVQWLRARWAALPDGNSVGEEQALRKLGSSGLSGRWAKFFKSLFEFAADLTTTPKFGITAHLFEKHVRRIIPTILLFFVSQESIVDDVEIA